MPISFAKALAALRSGDRVMLTYPSAMKASEDKVYAIAGSGKRISKMTFLKLHAALVPVRDGLFNDTTQTWALDDSKIDQITARRPRKAATAST